MKGYPLSSDQWH